MNLFIYKLKYLHFFLILLSITTIVLGKNSQSQSTASSSQKIVFSEVLYNSAVSSDTDGEWIELYNPQSTSIDISYWKIQDDSGSFTIPNGSTICPNSYFIITDNQSYFTSLYGCTPDIAKENVKLANSGDYLLLKDYEGNTIDNVAWGNDAGQIGWNSSNAPSASEGKSIIRTNPNQDANSPYDWSSNNTPTPKCGDCSGGGGGGGGGGGDLPFGSFDSPVEGSTARSSIAVTGWALDDLGIESVKIYRKEGNNSIYIGAASLVEGARPDVQQAYPGYPDNQKAGWGYMLLTNFLPNNGNGTFILEAKAKDTSGQETSLGTKTIYCDNANAVKPFGAIDTPTQGGTASSDSFINWGWVLAPLTNNIPVDGSTIDVFVDGKNLGHPIYNIYRSDIALLFPGYINSNGAVGYFYLDTTKLSNGVHTIQWTAKDSTDNIDGIGSRYFTVQNTSSDTHKKKSFQNLPPLVNCNLLENAPYSHDPIRFRTGFNLEKELQLLSFDKNSIPVIHIKEMERVEIHLGEMGHSFEGYLTFDDRLLPLPIGSTMSQGIFYWQPGPGFVGEYEFIFIENQSQERMPKTIKITISHTESQ